MNTTQRTGYHVRTENGVPTLVPSRDALAEVEGLQMMRPGERNRAIKSLSSGSSRALIEYRDGRKVDIRPATVQDVTELTPAPVSEELAAPAAPEWRTLKGTKVGDTLKLWTGNRKSGPQGEPRVATLARINGGWYFTFADTGWTGFIGGAASKHWVVSA